MILISHRGNVDGKINELENSPDYIQNALNMGYDVEIDLWVINNKLFLGHDEPVHNVDVSWIILNNKKLWVHCKNVESISFLNKNYNKLNYFWHENDTLTLTSKKYIWSYPGKQPILNSIAVMPELYNDDISKCIGICSDYISKYLIKRNKI
jgi:hypothetical protein